MTTNPSQERVMLTFNLCGYDFAPSLISTQSHLNSRVEQSEAGREKVLVHSHMLEASEKLSRKANTDS